MSREQWMEELLCLFSASETFLHAFHGKLWSCLMQRAEACLAFCSISMQVSRVRRTNQKRKSDNFSVLEQETEGREGRVKLWMPLECYRSLIQTRGSTQHLTGSRSTQRWDATAKTHQPGLASPLEVCEEKEIKYLYKCRWKGTSGSLQSTLPHRAGQSPISDQITCGFV